MFNSRALKTDVTALKIWEDILFTGIGGILHIYDVNSSMLIQKKEVFQGQKIYGIIPGLHGSQLILYGGKNITILTASNAYKNLQCTKPNTLSDWILDAKWIENDTKLVTMFMHNRISLWTNNFINISTVECEENCILYSAYICYNKYEDILVFSGTVFSEILLWKPFYNNESGYSPVLKRLKQHKGVIFSIDCDLELGYICSTSDDRSAVLWKIENPRCLEDLKPNMEEFEVKVVCQVYGHLSRVFRCCIIKNYFVTAGEDSLLMIWNFEGKLIRKLNTHQGGPIWSLDYHKHYDVVYSGGNDGGILKYHVNSTISTLTMTLPNEETPKLVAILSSGNIICLSEKATLYHYNKANHEWRQIITLIDLQIYSILQISPCQRKIALAGFNGQIYIFCEINNKIENITTYTFKNQSRIFSFHWISCQVFLVCQGEGDLSLCVLHNKKIFPLQRFILPPIKERWSTCACLLNGQVIVGDRKGNIHNYKIGFHYPINSQKKAHNYLGVTNLYRQGNVILSLGRDGVLKKHKIYNGIFKCIELNKTKFSWLISLVDNNLLSFCGNKIILSDPSQRILFEISCGGGHRSWGYLNNSQKFILTFIKQKLLNLVDLRLKDFIPDEIVHGYHVREINNVKAIKFYKDVILISGGEDTTLRISILKNDSDIQILQSAKSHLSSIRVIAFFKKDTLEKSEEYFLFTAGGRAQIICWNLCIESVNSSDVSVMCYKKHDFYEPLDHNEAENRIMDLSVVKTCEQVFLFAGCSDGFIKVFLVDKVNMKYEKSIYYKRTCITKLLALFSLGQYLLLSMATDGCIVFWNILDIMGEDDCSFLSTFKTHQSGISSCNYTKLSDSDILLLTGGDDNSTILTLFKLHKNEQNVTVSKISSFEDKGIHCAQITGAFIYDGYFITSSLDQRIVKCKWQLDNGEVSFQFLYQYISTVADQQGLEVLESKSNLSLFVYGNGIEYLTTEKG